MIRLERIGVNINDFEIPDNEGVLKTGAVEPDGPTVRISTLPLERIQQGILDAGIPARLSSTAGNFLCNALLYATLGIIEKQTKTIPAGFIHIPYLPSQVAGMVESTRMEQALELHQRADTASMALETTVHAIRIAIGHTLKSVQ